jgi:hypothetical protein
MNKEGGDLASNINGEVDQKPQPFIGIVRRCGRVLAAKLIPIVDQGPWYSALSTR